jgi:hypothetical protein
VIAWSIESFQPPGGGGLTSAIVTPYQPRSA